MKKGQGGRKRLDERCGLPPEVKAAVLGWLDSVHDGGARWKYNGSMSRPWAVESSAMAVSLLAGPLGERPAPQRRQELVAEIQGWQDPQTGLFQDPLITVKDHVENAVHTWEHIWNHHTGVCAEALETLGVAPLHALPGSVFGLDAESLTEDSIGQWVLGLAWENPWLAGEHFSRGVAALHRAGGSKAAVVERAFDVLAAEILNPATGCPDRRNQSGAHNAMAGLFKVILVYDSEKKALEKM